MSHTEDRWQLSWLPIKLKWAVISTFHQLDGAVDGGLWHALGVTPDHVLARDCAAPAMQVTRVRRACGVEPMVLEQVDAPAHPELGTGPDYPWPSEMYTPPRRTCTSCAHWGPDGDPDYDECCLAGDELLQAMSWYRHVGGLDGEPPHPYTTGCPWWRHLENQ